MVNSNCFGSVLVIFVVLWKPKFEDNTSSFGEAVKILWDLIVNVNMMCLW